MMLMTIGKTVTTTLYDVAGHKQLKFLPPCLRRAQLNQVLPHFCKVLQLPWVFVCQTFLGIWF